MRRVLILQTAPGRALQASLKEWQKTPNLHLTINTFQLPDVDGDFLREQYPQITQVKFDPFDPSLLIEQVKRANGYSIITMRINVPFPASMLEALTASDLKQPLKILGEAGSNVSHVDLVAAKKYNVSVTYTPGANANGVAEFTLAQIFCLLRSLCEYNQYTHDGMWAKYLLPPQEELNRKILGLIGFGHVARAVSQKAQALGMEVMVYTRTPSNTESESNITFVHDLRSLLRKANIISLHIPLTPATKQLLGANEIAMMQPGSYIINTARGGIVDEAAIAKELQKPDSILAGVAFDVFENEEEGRFQSPLINCKNALLTPHVAGTTNTALTDAATQLVKNISAIL
jgi:phosphoglycerate dehydrogenase-like enzyme